MKKRFLVVGVAVIAAALMTLCGYFILNKDAAFSAAIVPLSPVENPAELYASALLDLQVAEVTSLSVTTVRQTVVAGNSYSERSQQALIYSHLGTDAMQASVDEMLTIGKHAVHINEVYSQGSVYVDIAGSRFSGAVSPAAYGTKLTPAVLIDPALYGNCHGFSNGKQYTLFFTNPSGPETWSAEADSRFMDARGIVTISPKGKLLESVYTATFIRDEVTIHVTVTAVPATANATVAIPEDLSVYTPIHYIDGPRMLERASGYLLLAENISATYSDRIYCQAFGDERSRTVNLHTYIADGWCASVSTETVLSNTGRVGDVTRHLHEELFQDGCYTIRADGGEPTENRDIDPKAMQTYCKDQLVSTVMLPQDIANASCTQSEETLRITYSPNEVFAKLISANACQTLYQKPELMDDLAESSSTDLLQCYLELDRITGLPLASGIDYSGTYTIENLPYQLQYTAQQQYRIPGPTGE